jgi:tRNA 2-selenouridine synthase
VFPSLPISEFLSAAQTLPVIDVRSPAEFEKGHIPGAHNIPLFSNEERALVGTRYKQQGKDSAVLLGLEFVGPKMASFVKQAAALSKGRKLLVHCWRGGMRSSSFCWLLNTAGIEACTLRKGYKAYRHLVQKSFEAPLQMIVLGGETGSGKTDMLKQIAARGEQFIDLEGLAHHKGSSFGALGQAAQPSVEAFENLLAACIAKTDPARRVWVEDESRSIGRVFVPPAFWAQMKSAPLLRVEIPREERIKRLLSEYGSFSKEELAAAVTRIEKRLGGLSTKQCIDALEAGDLQTVASVTLDYYDKAYHHNHAGKEVQERLSMIHIGKDDPSFAADTILAYANEHIQYGK